MWENSSPTLAPYFYQMIIRRLGPTALIKPVHKGSKNNGLYRLRKNSVLYQGTTLVVP
jgi:hypothetical protein